MSNSFTMADLSLTPLAPNPNGDAPNFEGGATLEPTILATGIAFIAISSIFVFVRLGTNLRNMRRLHSDDYLCLLGEIVGITYWVVLYELQVKHGTAKHSWDIAVSSITPTVMKSQTAVQILTSIANPLVKGSILLFLLRLFGTLRWVRILCHGLFATILALYGAYLVILLSLCIPAPGHAWDSVLLARCSTTGPATIMIGVCGVLVDLAMFLMPLFIVSGLNIRRDKKRGLAIVFLIGFLIVVTSVVGLAYRIIASAAIADPIWSGAQVSITSYTEIFGTVIVSCTPALSSFWFGIFTKSDFYSSLQSIFSRSRFQSRSIQGSPIPGHAPFDNTESFSQCEYRPTFGRLHTPSSTQELTKPSPILLQAIQKSTQITQHSSEGLYGTGRQNGFQSQTGNIIRDEW
ncbi:hypothetical protein GGR53DRAFT_516931 [Hypoxylon sp. FL1150]|nr:hypothetical protein GGR53DRAFT_516931 [Hypoxylon sp. FL1150]